MVTVQGQVERNDSGGHAVELPIDPRAEFGTARPAVRVIAEDQLEFRTTLASYGGRCFLGLRKDQLAELGLSAGDPITVRIELDAEPREVEPPLELVEALAATPAAAAAFEELSYSHQRQYADWVGEAKQQSTRVRRAAKAVEQIIAGQER